MREISIPDFHAELKAQGVSRREDFAFRCPMCGTVQSAADLIAAGAGADFEAVERYLAFSCIGRFTDAGSHKKGEAPGRGCDWTLGGLFQLHKLQVIDEEGNPHPRFEPASPEDAQAHTTRFRADA